MRLMSAPYLAEVIPGRDNNFNLIRMLAASGVLVSHAYPISQGRGTEEPLEALIGFTSLGGLSVYVFFAISGLLIARSFDRSDSHIRFWAARILRIFPGLAVVLGLTALVAGPLLTAAPAGDYWGAVPVYLLRNLTLALLKYDLPGIFAANPYGTAINGSLWTLKYEVACYAGVALIGMAGLLRRRWAVIAGVLVIALLGHVARQADLFYMIVQMLELALPFSMGTALYVWRDRVRLGLHWGLGLALVAAVLHGTDLFQPVLAGVLSYWTFLAAYLPGGPVRAYNRLGDYSYGVYIYAFPVQQFVASQGVTDPLVNIALAWPVTLGFGIVSWYLVEKPCLGLLPPRRQGPAPATA